MQLCPPQIDRGREESSFFSWTLPVHTHIEHMQWESGGGGGSTVRRRRGKERPSTFFFGILPCTDCFSSGGGRAFPPVPPYPHRLEKEEGRKRSVKKCFFTLLLLQLPFLFFQLLAAVEGVKAVVAEQPREERPPLPPYPQLEDLNLDGGAGAGGGESSLGRWEREEMSYSPLFSRTRSGQSLF